MEQTQTAFNSFVKKVDNDINFLNTNKQDNITTSYDETNETLTIKTKD